jgi:hypothetical protein
VPHTSISPEVFLSFNRLPPIEMAKNDLRQRLAPS